jgi:hypothetical protein
MGLSDSTVRTIHGSADAIYKSAELIMKLSITSFKILVWYDGENGEDDGHRIRASEPENMPLSGAVIEEKVRSLYEDL